VKVNIKTFKNAVSSKTLSCFCLLLVIKNSGI
jgi:hypothetical protein